MGVKDIDKGWNRIQAELKRANGSFTKVGVQAGTMHKGSGKTPKISDLVMIASVNEFGTKDGKIPPRPAHKQAFDSNKKDIVSLQTQLFKKVYSGLIGVPQAMGLLGEFMESKIKKSINTLTSPRNAASTEKKKGANNPLVDTGLYKNSIRHVEVIK